MLKVYNRNKERVSAMDYCQNCTITRRLEMDERTLQFSLPINEFNNYAIEIGGYILTEETLGYGRTDPEEFVIKEISKTSDGNVTVVAPLNLEDFEGYTARMIRRTEGVDLLSAVELFLNRWPFYTPWSAMYSTDTETTNVLVPARATFDYRYVNSYNAIKQLISLFHAECEFDQMYGTIVLYKHRGSDRGVYFSNELNLLSLEARYDGNNLYSEIQPMGKDDLDIGDPKYIRTTDYSTTNTRRCFWRDDRYTDATTLRNAAIDKLTDLKYPKVTYTIKTMDLASMDPEHYNFLSYMVGDYVTIIDSSKGIKDRRRITEIVDHLFEPSENTCVIGDALETYEELIDNISTSTGATTNNYQLTSSVDANIYRVL